MRESQSICHIDCVILYARTSVAPATTAKMVLFILTETSAGYALLKAKDKKLLKRDDIAEETKTAEGTTGLLKLKEFKKFENAASALEEAAALTDGKVCPRRFPLARG